MENQSVLLLSQEDFLNISALLKSTESNTMELLEEELGRAHIVPDESLPKDVVSMNATVRFKDLSSGKESVITLVYPHEANLEENRISILAPIGSALIGLRVGQTIGWPLHNGKEKNLKVVSVEPKP